MRGLTVSITSLALTLAACGGGSGGPTPGQQATASPTPAPVAIKVAYSNITGDNLALWVAKDAGILQRNGLDATLVLVDGGSRTMAALLSGEVQIAQLGGSEVLSAKAGGADLVIAATLAPVYPYLFMVAPGVKAPADLKGKKVGVSSVGGSADIATRRVLRTVGLDPDKDVSIIALGSHAQRTAGLIAGAIDGGVDDPPDTVKLQQLGFHSLFDLAALKLPAANTTVVAQAPWVNANRSVMQRYVDSLVQAIAYAKRNRATTVATLKKYFGTEAESGFEEAYDFFVNEVTPALPFPKAEQFADAQAELGKKNDKVKALDVRTILDASFVQRAADRGLDKEPSGY